MTQEKASKYLQLMQDVKRIKNRINELTQYAHKIEGVLIELANLEGLLFEIEEQIEEIRG